MEIDYAKLEFSPIFREGVLEQFRSICKEEYTDFLKLFLLFGDLNTFLSSKHSIRSNETKEYYVRLMNIRVKDHFASAFILASQGFLVDAVSLTRSSLEDLFVVINFYLKKDFFADWYANENNFKISPSDLRNNPKIPIKDRKLYNSTYKHLSNIVHPKINSLSHMTKFHPSFEAGGSEGVIRLKKDARLIVSSFWIYLHQMCRFLQTVFTGQSDIDALESIRKKVMEIPMTEL